MSPLKVKDFRTRITHQPLLVPEAEPINRIIEVFLSDSSRRTIFVVDSQGSYLGYITVHMLLDAIFLEDGEMPEEGNYSSFYGLLGSKETAKDIMDREPLGVWDELPMEEALHLMQKKRLGELPVLSRENRIIGELHVLEVLQFWKTALKK